MESRRTSDLSLPYGKIAMWGIALSVVVTGAYLALAPSSPARMAAQALDGRPPVSGALLPDGRHLPTAVEVGRRAVEEVLGENHHVEHRWVHEHDGIHDHRVPEWLRIVPDLGVELGGEWSRVVPQLGAEMAREWVRMAPRMRAEIRREWREMAPELRDELRRELRRELRGLSVEFDVAPSGVSVDGA